MKINEMFKKVETYNEIAEMIGSEKIYIGCDIGTFNFYRATTAKELKAAIRADFFKWAADPIIAGDYEIGETAMIGMTDPYGKLEIESVEFNIYTR